MSSEEMKTTAPARKKEKSFGKERFETFTAILSLCIFVGIIGVLFYWCFLVYLYLKEGGLPDDLGSFIVYYFRVVWNIKNDWLSFPDSWLGLHKIVIWLLGFSGPGGLVLILSIILLWIIEKSGLNE